MNLSAFKLLALKLLRRRICFGVVPILEPTFGGQHQYTLTMLDALMHMELPDWIDVTLVLQPDDVTSLPSNLPHAWRRIIIPDLRVGHDPEFTPAQVNPLAASDADADSPRHPIRHNATLAQYLRRQKIDWLLFTTTYYRPGRQAFEIGLPYVMPVYDLQHRLQPEFPEVSEGSEWEMREYLFRNGIRNASVILVDSEVGKEDVLTFYGEHGARPDRIVILPYLPATYLHTDVTDAERARVRTTYNVPKRFLFYPAQFWPHKNHRRIVEAIVEARKRGTVINAVFCGSPNDELRRATLQDVVSVAEREGITEQIRLLGYIPNADVSPLYAQAVALVMPTFFGPTCTPILEAWACGCPVLTSDIRGIREQVGNAAVLVDPRSVEAITNGIIRLWQDGELRAVLALRGRERLANYTAADYRSRLASVILSMCHRAASGELHAEEGYP